MRYLKFLLPLLLAVGLIVFLSTHNPLGLPIPALGPLLSPGAGFWQNAPSDAEISDETLSLPGLQEAVMVHFDAHDVPHIFAQNDADAFFAQGYLSAYFRLWQMDISTRAVSGRLSEVLGDVTLERDKLQRRKGIVRTAERLVATWKESPAYWSLLQAHCAGINAYIRQLPAADYPLEFKLLDYTPEEWTPMHAAYFYMSMAEILCARSDDVALSNARTVLGPALFDDLFPEYTAGQSPIIPVDTPWPFEPVAFDTSGAAATMISELLPILMPDPGPDFRGSNNWAISGAKSRSGSPILCSDPHLNLTLPSIWFELQIHTPDMNAYGVSFPPIPGIFIGFNERVAWAETNVSHDVMDWYSIRWLDEQKETYAYDGRARRVDYREERILVKGMQEPVIERVKYTQWGPIVHTDPDSRRYDMAMYWIVQEPFGKKEGYGLRTFIDLMKAQDYDDYYAALQYFEWPAQNFAFAAQDGDIAITVNGKLPLKREGQGRLVQDGSNSAGAWQGFIPYDQLPRVRNPERGFVSSANQHSTDPSYPYYYNGRFDDYRGRYINQRLDSMDNIEPEDLIEMQLDEYSLFGPEITALLLPVLAKADLSEKEQYWQQQWSAWDHRFTAAAKVPVLAEAVKDSLHRLSFDELYLFEDSLSLAMPEKWLLIEQAAIDTLSIFDRQETPARERASDLLLLAFRQAVQQYGDSLRSGELDWGRFKLTRIQHLANLPAFSRTLPETGGYADAINATQSSVGPSWRMVVELSDPVQAYGVYPGGQSGRPGSPLFNNTIEDWRTGNYHELWLMDDSSDDEYPLRATWRLTPKN